LSILTKREKVDSEDPLFSIDLNICVICPKSISIDICPWNIHHKSLLVKDGHMNNSLYFFFVLQNLCWNNWHSYISHLSSWYWSDVCIFYVFLYTFVNNCFSLLYFLLFIWCYYIYIEWLWFNHNKILLCNTDKLHIKVW
jgi:hypothetical protein